MDFRNGAAEDALGSGLHHTWTWSKPVGSTPLVLNQGLSFMVRQAHGKRSTRRICAPEGSFPSSEQYVTPRRGGCPRVCPCGLLWAPPSALLNPPLLYVGISLSFKAAGWCQSSPPHSLPPLMCSSFTRYAQEAGSAQLPKLYTCVLCIQVMRGNRKMARPCGNIKSLELVHDF